MKAQPPASTASHKAATLWDEAASAKAELGASTEDQLREANEHLVVAAVQAQTMTDAAELAVTQMAHMAEHDFLTGLPNRWLLTDRLAQSLALAERHSGKIALLFLDLDDFKQVNDSLGHAMGDRLLQAVANRLQECVRRSDTVSRQGGDEFLVLLTEVKTRADAALAARKIIEALAQPSLIEGQRIHVTSSIGISLYPDDAKSPEALLKNADTAMYCAKRSGRNNYQLFTPGMEDQEVTRQSVEAALRHALDHREFVLHYQPMVNLDTGAMTGAEALLRWQRSDHPLSCPGEFFGIAEDCGLILPIGQWVLREACRQMQAWSHAGRDVGQIAVNVSAVEFHGPDFVSGVRAILDDTGLDPHRLELELAESSLMHNTEQTMVNLLALKGLGVRITVDDFGVGYSSLSFLVRFPSDTLKIDRACVQDGAAGNAIVSAVIAMGVNLGRRVVAAGIETRQQFVHLQSLRCTEGQGYYVGRPVAADEFAAPPAAGRRL